MFDASKLKNEKAMEEFELAQYFIKTYSASRAGLNRMGILRSKRDLQGDYAEWLAAKLLDLKLAESTIQKGYDAIDKMDKTYQVKCRLVDNVNQQCSWDFKTIDTEFDIFIGVFMSYDFDLLGMIKVSHDVVAELGVKTSHDFRFRWNKRIARDPRIERLFWDEEDFSELDEELYSDEVATTMPGENTSETPVKLNRHQKEKNDINGMITSTNKAINLVQLMTKKLYQESKQRVNEAGFKNITFKTYVYGQQVSSAEQLVSSKYSEQLDHSILEAGVRAGISEVELLESIQRAKSGSDYLNYLYLRACRYMNARELLDNIE